MTPCSSCILLINDRNFLDSSGSGHWWVRQESAARVCRGSLRQTQALLHTERKGFYQVAAGISKTHDLKYTVMSERGAREFAADLQILFCRKIS